MVEESMTEQRLKELFSATFNVDAPDADTDLLEAGILDSFQFVELLMKLEQDFGFEVDIQTIDLDDLRSLERIARLVEASTGHAVNGRAPSGRPDGAMS